MTSLIVDIFEFLKRHRVLRWLSLSLLTLCLAGLVLGQTYKEDISDFLPLDSKYRQALDVYQDFSGADRIIVLFQFRDSTMADPDSMTVTIADFQQCLETMDSAGLCQDLTTQIDAEQLSGVADFVYANIPYFLTEADYARMDSLLASDDYVTNQLVADKQLLMLPVSGLFSENFSKDPLNLFTPAVSRLQHSQPDVNYELYDGYIFSPDRQYAFAMMRSPYGSSETENNARLLQLLRQAADKTMAAHGQIDFRFIGGPVIAVENASQIKRDSLLSVLLAIVLIVGLLLWVFRDVRNLLLIVLSIAWGWLFAMGMLAVFHDNVSVIVIGISSVILGIAVNYPLHLIAHLRHTPDMKNALKEIVMPLVVGNVTTVGAFLALVPLRSVALRDLGTFAALLLIGTIVFVLIWLPHMVRASHVAPRHSLLDRISDFSIENQRWVVAIVALLTLVLGFFSMKTTFDANMSHINYMTPEQHQDMAYFQRIATQASDEEQTIYIVSSDSTLEGAVSQNAALSPALKHLDLQGEMNNNDPVELFLATGPQQRQRLERWNDFVSKHAGRIEQSVRAAGASLGFAPTSFDGFYQLLHTPFAEQPLSYFNPLISTALASRMVMDSTERRYHVIREVAVPADRLKQVEAQLEKDCPNVLTFDVASMNSSIATNLSDDFNYIGWACALIVFLFLWFSLGSLELAMLSFLPMAVSWVWILGIMALLGIHFNVVNVILATFIFGQGDDYTIFMTEGCQYEYAHGRKMLASYKSSIIISALIMFIGIGTLIFAKHPALHSLAQVTIVGMFSVVLMAYLFPPLIFKWLTTRDGVNRKCPITLRSLLSTGDKSRSFKGRCRLVLDNYKYCGIEIYSAVKKRMNRYGGYAQWLENSQDADAALVIHAGWGELPLLLSFVKPGMEILAVDEDPDKVTVMARRLATHNPLASAEVLDEASTPLEHFMAAHPGACVYLIEPSQEDIEKYEHLNPVVIGK